MGNIISIIGSIQSYLVLIILLIVIILLIIFISILKAINKLEKKYNMFMRNLSDKNIEELLINYFDKIDDVKSSNDEMKDTINKMNNEVNKCIQKYSIIRYKAFDDVGSDLSFSISLLDNNNNGLILTGIFGRNECTTYAKPIENGISKYELSIEEKQALEDAISKNDK